MAKPFTLTGLDRFKAKLNALPEALRQSQEEAITTGMNELADAMRRAVPEKTGALRDSIQWGWGDEASGTGQREGRGAQIAAKGDLRLAATITAGGPRAFWAAWVEWGTSKHPASPFFYSSFRSLKKRIAGRMRRAASRAIKQTAGK